MFTPQLNAFFLYSLFCPRFFISRLRILQNIFVLLSSFLVSFVLLTVDLYAQSALFWNVKWLNIQ